MSLTPGSTSYLPVLIKVMQIAEGPVVGLGAGPMATALMHWMCLEAKRPRLITYESDPDYFEVCKSFGSNFHEVKFVNDWSEAPLEAEHYGVAFVDHLPPARRKVEVARLAKIADYIVVHDTESQREAEFGFHEESFSLFRYSFHYQRQKPYTSVLSNFMEFYL